MKFLSKWISQLLSVTMMALPFSAQAGMISTDQVVVSAQDQANRGRVLDFVSRADVAKQMEALGLSAANAQDRVGAMTQEEINQIAGKIDTLPAGASDGWWIAAVVIVGLIIYFYWYKR